MKTKGEVLSKTRKNLEIKSRYRGRWRLCFNWVSSLQILLLKLIHRRNEFRGALDSVEKVQELKDLGK
jgi:hypothetical protein